MHETKISEKIISEYFGDGVLVFSEFFFSEEFGTQKIGGGYCKFRLNGSGGFNKISGVGILENLLAAKIQGNCVYLVVSYFLIVFGNIIANCR